MVLVKSEFALALNQVASERGISVGEVVSSMEAAILAAFRKEHPELFTENLEDDNGISVKVNVNSGETQILKDGKDITPPGFGRIAAQTARQVVIQKIREAERKMVISHYQDQVGTLVRGRIIRRDGSLVYADIGKSEAILPREEQMKNENYNVNDKYIFLLKEIGTTKNGFSRILLSRKDPALVEALFKREVPEISNGSVEIKKVVREAGERAKIAVYSSQSGIDPVGACVGQKGMRVQAITDELGGREKIDIVPWNSDPVVFITNSLQPAQIKNIKIDETSKKAVVTVAESQAPLAIGRGGTNVNLASSLTEYSLDINQVSESGEDIKAEADKKPVETVQEMAQA
jgi:N utilization substance protein A